MPDFMFISCKELEKGGMQAMLKASRWVRVTGYCAQ